ncbi:ABC transporter permease [Kineococcus sp. SYSU DK002]|uniref:ABC transporter permease n=1 Tax=Kineococcus sp. SYSU DK002 TaxID=3383123 RepID=UPI003D7D88A1
MTTRLVADTVALTGRSLRHVTRSPDTLITTAVMPIAIMLLFVHVLGGAIDTGPQPGSGSYVDYLLPGILLMTVATGVSYTAHRLFGDLRGGVLDRFRSLPVARSAVLWAHVLTSLVANLVSVAVVVAVAFATGFRTGAGLPAVLAVAGVLTLFVLALTWVAVVAGLSATSVEGATAFSYPLVLLPFVSSAFVPTASMPGPVRWFAEHQPVTPVVDTIRDLLAGRPASGDLWVALAWCVGVLVVACATATAAYRRRGA